jgi:hypothetical protein
LHISGDADQGLVNLSWLVEESLQRPYKVSKESLLRASSDVRDILSRVTAADDFERGDPFESFQSDLCRAGSVLFSNLFAALDGDRQTAENVRDYLSEPPPPETGLLITTDGLIHVPWNFVALPLSSPTQYSHLFFNHFKIRVTSLCGSILQQRRLPLQSKNFRVLFAIHKPFFDQAINSRYLSIGERELWEKISSLPVGTRIDWDSCEQAWSQISKYDSVISILGHSEGDEIHLFEIDPTNRDADGIQKYIINYAQLLACFRKRAGSCSDSLLMINVCSSAVTNERYGPLAIAYGNGFHGLIGSEANILNVFALKYSLKFLGYLLAGEKNVGQAFDQTRQDLFPRSLLYTCYADPRFAVQPVFA